jgi:Flp pilus assembly protein TadG
MMRRPRNRQRGQSLVEFAMVLPIMAVMLCAVLEFGMAFDADLTLSAASREGARIGATIGNDGTRGVCPDATAQATVDPAIIASVQASLTNAGFDLAGVNVTIYLANATGGSTGTETRWVWNTTSHSFVANGGAWPACGRHDGSFGGGIYDSIGVRVDYTYHSKTGLLALFSSGYSMTETTVMPIGPPWK